MVETDLIDLACFELVDALKQGLGLSWLCILRFDLLVLDYVLCLSEEDLLEVKLVVWV